MASAGAGGWDYQGEAHGYGAGGWAGPWASAHLDRFSFTSDANGTDVGSATGSQNYGGSSSETHGYTPGGYPYQINIRKHAFASSGSESDSGADLTSGHGEYSISCVSSEDHGYAIGGSGPASGGARSEIIDRWDFASDSGASDVGDDISISMGSASFSGPDGYGYLTKGHDGNKITTTRRFAIASSSNASDIGNGTINKEGSAACTGSDYGYASGGGYPYVNVQERMPYASTSNGVDIGDATSVRGYPSGYSNTSGYCYQTGGTTGGGGHTNVIEKFSQSSTANSTDIADIYTSRYYMAPSQN